MQRIARVLISRSKMAPRLAATAANSTAKPRVSFKYFSSAATTDDASGQQQLKPWNTHVRECHGDYRQEAFMEDGSLPLYAKQAQLPRLPVPEIKETLQRLLPTVLPLAESPQEEASLKACVDAFEAQAQTLQERLLQRREEFKDSSWLQHWWNTMGYLQVRDRSPINVSYFFQFRDDPSAMTNAADSQIQRAAAMLWHAAAYRQQVCSGNMPQETLGKKKIPLCSTALKYMFHACRLPKKEQDSYAIYDPSRYTHAIVACKGQFYAVDFLDAQGNVVPVQVLEERLAQCAQLAATGGGSAELGWLTAMNRDEWAEARQALLAAGGASMQQALEQLQSAALVVCLDDEKPVSRQELSHVLLHGLKRNGEEPVCNRWFDKSIHIIVAKNGKAGLLGEHTMMDGMPMVGFSAHIAKHSYKDAVEGSMSYNGNPSGGVEPVFDKVLQELQGSASVDDWVQLAKNDYTRFVDAHDVEVQSFQGYGSDFMKKAGYSPDAFAQMAMQVATYRLFGKQAGTYEASQVRVFLHGRTETTRSVSLASNAFCKLMGLTPQFDEHDEAARKKKLETLQDAVTAHVEYLGKAGQGKGVDRHLLGLSLCAKEGDKLPALYSDPTFVRAKRWRVSTSNLTHPLFDNWGYGEVVPDGVGLSYSVHPRYCMFNVTSLKETGYSTKLCQLLEEALLEMRTLIEVDQQATGQSKL